MTTQTKPSAGALRAAKAVRRIPIGWDEEIAEIIDRESGLAELLEACRMALEERQQVYSQSITVDILRTAIEKAEKGTNSHEQI